jgi:hypothetical protein
MARGDLNFERLSTSCGTIVLQVSFLKIPARLQTIHLKADQTSSNSLATSLSTFFVAFGAAIVQVQSMFFTLVASSNGLVISFLWHRA